MQRWKVYKTKIRDRATLKAIIQEKYLQGRPSSHQSAGADPLLLKCSWRGREAVLGLQLRALKMVYLVPTQYFNAVTNHQFFECFIHFKVCPFFPCGCLEAFLSHF